MTLDCDVAIVGSGAGGGMAARELAAAGQNVLVLEKGGYFNESDFSQREVAMLDKLYWAGGYGANRTYYVSFHQMGTCRMGANPQTSVVNGDGETHAVRNLYVADGSLFPTASGVNPMLTIAALGHYVAGRIARR